MKKYKLTVDWKTNSYNCPNTPRTDVHMLECSAEEAGLIANTYQEHKHTECVNLEVVK